MSNAVKRTARSLVSTILLPKTSFPARATAEDLSRYLTRCSDDLYSWQSRSRPVDKSFILHDGPPYANGDLHVGHALNKILKDIICRFHLGQGKRIEYVPGWDCHGLPIELKALQQHQLNTPEDRTPPTPIEVRQIARKLAETAVESQKNQFRSWGVMADWNNAWKTMDKDFELRQLFIFLALFGQGLVTRKHKPVYWSPSSRTALAEAELEYNEDHESTAALVAIRIDAPKSMMAGQYVGLKALIWTTTPWTLPANQAIAVREEMLYTVIDSKKFGHLLVAKSRLDFVREKVQDDISIIQDDIPGSFFVKSGFTYRSIFDKDDMGRPIFAAPFVTDSTGTGVVHCAPGHGMEDYDALRQEIKHGKVRVKAPIDDGGIYTQDAIPDDPDYLAGSDILGDGQKKVLDFLSSKNMLLAAYPYKHKYPYDWRSKQPVVIRATEQWFADVHGIKNKSVQSLSSVKFLPQSGKSRLTSFLEHRNEWCISRQRAWGVPIPALYDLRTGEAIMTDQTVSHIMQVLRDRGTDAWWSDPPDDPAWIQPRLLQTATAGDFRRGTDTLDVWFDSGTSWAQLMSRPEGAPLRSTLADLYIEGTDQHRGWFQSSLLTRIAYQTSLASQKDSPPVAPYASLVTHGFTLDEQGRKMSKSLGNVISPTDIIRGTFHKVEASKQSSRSKPTKQSSDLGPDVLRLWVASSDFTTDISISPQSLSNVQGALHKFRTTFKLLLGALSDFSPSTPSLSPNTALPMPDQLALWRLSKLTTEVLSSYSAYEFHRALTSIIRYINSDLSANYIESIKDRLYCDAANSHSRRSVQTVLYHILQQLQSLLSPICPLLVEESFHHSPLALQTSYPFHRSWALDQPALESTPAENEATFETTWTILTKLNSTVKGLQERARDAKNLRSSLQSCVTISSPSPSSLLLSSILSSSSRTYGGVPSALADHFGVSHVSIVDTTTTPPTPTPENTTTASAPGSRGGWIYTDTLPLPLTLPNGVETQDLKVKITLTPPRGEKCDRCWKYTVTEASIPIPAAVRGGISFEKDSLGNKGGIHKEGQEEEEEREGPKLCKRCIDVLQDVVSSSSSSWKADVCE